MLVKLLGLANHLSDKYRGGSKDTQTNTLKQTQTIFWLVLANCLNVFHHFVGLALKGLTLQANQTIYL